MELLESITLSFLFVFIGYYVTRFLDKNALPSIEKARQKAISGIWEGTYYQQDSDNRSAIDIDIKFELEAGRKAITGKMYVIEEDSEFEFSVHGSLSHNKYLRLEYNADGDSEDAIDFGSIFFILGDFPKKMNGKLIGYGSISETLIYGDIMISKIKQASKENHSTSLS